jgi:hypothetical protein
MRRENRRLGASVAAPCVAERKDFLAVIMCRKVHVLHYSFQSDTLKRSMLLSKEYVGYLARQITQKLIGGEFIETKDALGVSEALNLALLEELQLEDRINDEVRLILEQYQDEMQRAGASYQEMFKKVKGELVRKYKAVL